MQPIKTADLKNSLHELGCSAELAGEIMQLVQNGNTQNAALLLRRCKPLLLSQLHTAERKVDLLDFLLYRLKNAEPHSARKDDSL